jgi:CubicO group peptidase (beta-lactamase class C family)
MRYGIGSVSKQFTAAAVLMLAEEKRLSLDDRVGRFLPEVTRSNEIRIRDLLGHTSGLQDYLTQDYVPAFMHRDTTPTEVAKQWAARPLDFEPRSRWQYSNTGYTLAGLIVEKVTGEPLFEFLQKRIFRPLGMNVVDLSANDRGPDDPEGYTHYGLGPPRVAPREGKGWLFGAAGLAMSAGDLARWNIAVMNREILSPASWAEMETEGRLENGLGTRYGLGLVVDSLEDHRELSHNGEVSGFAAVNLIFPDDLTSVTVLANDDIVGLPLAWRLARRIASGLLEAPDPRAEARAEKLFTQLQQGRLDRTLLSPNAAAYFTREAIRDIWASLRPLGPPMRVQMASRSVRGGMTTREFVVTCSSRTLSVVERDLPNGEVEQFMMEAAH